MNIETVCGETDAQKSSATAIVSKSGFNTMV